MSITQSMELPIVPAQDEAHPSVIACRAVLRRQEAEIERLRQALDDITDGVWHPGTPCAEIVSDIRARCRLALSHQQNTQPEKSNG